MPATTVVRDDRAAKATSPGRDWRRRRRTEEHSELESSSEPSSVVASGDLAMPLLALRAANRLQLSLLWGAKSGVSGLTFWEHVTGIG